MAGRVSPASCSASGYGSYLALMALLICIYSAHTEPSCYKGWVKFRIDKNGVQEFQRHSGKEDGSTDVYRSFARNGKCFVMVLFDETTQMTTIKYNLESTANFFDSFKEDVIVEAMVTSSICSAQFRGLPAQVSNISAQVEAYIEGKMTGEKKGKALSLFEALRSYERGSSITPPGSLSVDEGYVEDPSRESSSSSSTKKTATTSKSTSPSRATSTKAAESCDCDSECEAIRAGILAKCAAHEESTTPENRIITSFPWYSFVAFIVTLLILVAPYFLYAKWCLVAVKEEAKNAKDEFRRSAWQVNNKSDKLQKLFIDSMTNQEKALIELESKKSSISTMRRLMSFSHQETVKAYLLLDGKMISDLDYVPKRTSSQSSYDGNSDDPSTSTQTSYTSNGTTIGGTTSTSRTSTIAARGSTSTTRGSTSTTRGSTITSRGSSTASRASIAAARLSNMRKRRETKPRARASRSKIKGTENKKGNSRIDANPQDDDTEATINDVDPEVLKALGE